MFFVAVNKVWPPLRIGRELRKKGKKTNSVFYFNYYVSLQCPLVSTEIDTSLKRDFTIEFIRYFYYSYLSVKQQIARLRLLHNGIIVIYTCVCKAHSVFSSLYPYENKTINNSIIPYRRGNMRSFFHGSRDIFFFF